MNILFTNRPEKAWIGGDYIQMVNTANHLAALDNYVEIIEQPLLSPAIRVREFDVIHTWNFSMEWAKYAVIMGEIHKKPVVCSMIYHESDQYIPYPQQQIMANVSKALIFLNQGELDRVERHLTIDHSKVHFVENGIDEFWFKKVKVKAKEDFILTVGRVEPSKGQLAVAKACKKMGIKYVCVGERHDEDYSKKVEALGAILTGPKDRDELINLYATCKVMVLASRAEIMSLVVMEAMAQNAKIVLTDHSEWKPTDISLCEWNNPKSIEDAIKFELEREEDGYFRKDQVKDLTWKNVAKKINDIYKDICSQTI